MGPAADVSLRDPEREDPQGEADSDPEGGPGQAPVDGSVQGPRPHVLIGDDHVGEQPLDEIALFLDLGLGLGRGDQAELPGDRLDDEVHGNALLRAAREIEAAEDRRFPVHVLGTVEAHHPLRARPGLATVAERVNVPRKSRDLDTPENRFAKMVLVEFRDFLVEVGMLLGRDVGEATKLENSRLLREVARLRGTLDRLLERGFLPDVSPPEILPLGSPVLQRKAGYRELLRAMHPSAIWPVRIRGAVVSQNVLSGVMAFGFIYMVSIVSLTLIMSGTGLDIVTAFSAVVACLNNTGPGLNLVGPATTYAVLNDFQTWICTFAMLLGRLEILTLLVVLMPAFWRK